MLLDLYVLNESMYPKRWYVLLHISYGELYVVEEFSFITILHIISNNKQDPLPNMTLGFMLEIT